MPRKVVSQATHGYKTGNWEAAKTEAAQILKTIAESKGLTTYGELARQISAISFDPHGYAFRHFLGELSSESDAAGRGMITALVIYKVGDQLPGPGFFELARKLGRDVTDRVKCWSNEVKRVHDAAAPRLSP